MTSVSGWIIGEQAAEKIVFLANVFHKSRIDSFNRTYGTCHHNYRPWMSSKYLAESFKDHVGAQTKDCFNREYLEEYQKRLERCAQFTLFYENAEDPIRIYTQIENEVPNAKEEFDEALALIKRASPWIAHLYDSIIFDVIPIRRLSHARGAGSATNFHLIGTLFLSLRRAPFAKLKTAISYAHEVAHTSLMIIQNGDPIANEPDTLEIYSPIRRVNRPFLAAFHAVVASSYMLCTADSMLGLFDKGSEEASYLQSFRKMLLPELRVSIGQLEKIRLTAMGKVILREAKVTLL